MDVQRSNLSICVDVGMGRDCRDAHASHHRLGATHAVCRHFTGQQISVVGDEYPQVEIEVAEGLVARVLPRLREGSLDFAVVADTGDLPEGEFTRKVLLRCEQHVVVRENHPILKASSLHALSALEWVLTGPRACWHSDRLNRLFEKAGHAPPTMLVICETLAGLTLLRNSDVAGVVPEPLLRQPEGRGLVPLQLPEINPGSFDLALIQRPDVPLTPAAEFMARCVADACVTRLT